MRPVFVVLLAAVPAPALMFADFGEPALCPVSEPAPSLKTAPVPT